MSSDRAALATQLLAQRESFRRFLAARLDNDADAEDLLQQGLVKALQHADEIKDTDRAIAWFYQILRHALIDHARSRTATRQRDHAWSTEVAAAAPDAAAEREICQCFEQLLPTLKPAHAELLRRVELRGDSVSAAAIALGITANNASVTLHRARAELRKKLESFCGPCAGTACLDCDCA